MFESPSHFSEQTLKLRSYSKNLLPKINYGLRINCRGISNHALRPLACLCLILDY